MGWVGFHDNVDVGVGLRPLAGITSLNLLGRPVRCGLTITSRKPVLREVELSQGHTISGRARIPNQAYLMLETGLSLPSAPLIRPSSSFTSGS